MHTIVADDIRWARRVLTRTTWRYRHLREDIESEGLVGLQQAALAFRDGGVTFRAFAYPRVLGAASDWLRMQTVRVTARTRKKRMGKEVGGWDCDTIAAEDQSVPLEEQIDYRRQKTWLSRIIAELPNRRVASMVSMRIYGEKTLSEIGRAHGITESGALWAIRPVIRALAETTP